jgi:hypothetical protein
VMKLNRSVLYAILFAGIVLLLSGVTFYVYSLVTSRISSVPTEAGTAEEKKLPELYDEVNDSIEKARGIARELGAFNWNEFAAAGLLPPPGGMCSLGDRVGEKAQFVASPGCKWVTLPEMLPRPESAGVLVRYCDISLEMAKKVRDNIPSDNSTLTQWQELCGQLGSNLQGAASLASNYRNTNGYVLTKLEEGINSSEPVIKQKYLEKFQSKSAKYLSLFDELIKNLQQAEQATLQLTNWQFKIFSLP